MPILYTLNGHNVYRLKIPSIFAPTFNFNIPNFIDSVSGSIYDTIQKYSIDSGYQNANRKTQGSPGILPGIDVGNFKKMRDGRKCAGTIHYRCMVNFIRAQFNPETIGTELFYPPCHAQSDFK